MASLAEPFIGRSLELQELERALDALSGGVSACVTVEGEPGIGKTRLLSELRGRAEERNLLVLEGRASEFDNDLPFGVLVDALDAYLASFDPESIEDWDPATCAELAAIFPSMRRAAPEASAGLGEERYRAHRAVRWLLERLAVARSLVLTLDDVHWADEASIEVIGSLLRRGPAAGVLLVLAFRPRQAPERLSAALAVPEVERLELTHLTAAEAEQLLGAPDAFSLATLYGQAGGNPFYLQQLARVAPDGLLPAPAAGGRAYGVTDVPPAVAASLAGELSALSDPARTLLQAAAVAGEPFEADVAAEIAQQPRDEALGHLDELIALDLVRPTAVPTRFAFRHPLMLRAVYESAPRGWRLLAHARAAEGLAARGAAAGELAHHVESSAAQGDEAAIAVLLEAARSAMSRGPATAARWLEAVLRLLPADNTERQVDVRESLASALRARGELRRSRATLLEALELLPDAAGERRVRLTASCAAIENWLGHNDEAHRRLMHAWETLPDAEGPAAAALELELAVDGLFRLDLEQAFDMGERALATARALDDPALIATAAATLCFCKVAAGDLPAATSLRETAAEIVDRLPDEQLSPHLEAFYHLGWSECYLWETDAASVHLERGLAISRAIGDGRLVVPLTLAAATPKEVRGNLPAAIELCEAAVEAARLTDNPQYLYWTLWELGWRHYLAGDIDAAIEACEQSARTVNRLAGSFMRMGSGEPGWTLGAALMKAGDVERGREVMLQGVGQNLERVMPVERPWALEILTVAELSRGRIDVAEEHARQAEEVAEMLGVPIPKAIAARARAEVLLATGHAAEAAEVVAKAIETTIATGAHLDTAWSRSMLGRALVAAGDRKAAIATLKQAEEDLEAVGSVRERDAVRRELRKLGVRTQHRGRGGSGEGISALTARELEIAELVTERKTNHQIAVQLYLSEKTVESHMRNIFVKLGVSSRVDVARAVEESRS